MFEIFIQNAALLLTLSFLNGIITFYRPKKELPFRLLNGAWFGIIAIAAMMMPYHFQEGTIYDGRSVILTLAGLWGGGISTLVAVAISGAYRIFLGGTGVYVGVATIIFCSLTGLIFRSFLHKKLHQISFYNFWIIGLVSHVVMLGCQLFLPTDPLLVVKQIGVPVLLIFPVAFALIAQLFKLIDRYIYNTHQIKDAEELYRTTLLSIGDAVICTDNTGKITQMNAIAEKLTGWNFSEAKGRMLDDVFEIIDEGSREKIESPVQKVISTGSIVELSNHPILVSKNGSEIPVADSGAPIKNKSNQIIGVVVVFRDQTEEREQQQVLEKSEADYREREFWLRESQRIGRIGSYSLDIKSGQWRSSDVLDEIFGISSQDEHTVVSWNEIIHPEQREEMMYYFQHEVVENKTAFEKEYRIKRADNGAERWVHGRGELRFNESGEAVTMIGTIQDITLRKQYEAQLLDSEARFRNAILMAPIPIMVHDDTGKILNVSEGWTHFSGYSIDEIPTLKTWTQKAFGNNAEEMQNYHEHLFNTQNTTFGGEHEITSKSGAKRIWNFFHTPLGKTGGKKIMLNIAPDITQRIRTQNELVVAKERAEESERLKSAFLANVSHEIRTPLNGIVGFSNILAEDENLSPKEKQEFAQLINKSSDGLLKIINDILDISRLETGRTKIDKKPFEVNAMLDNVYSIFKKRLADTNITRFDFRIKKPQQNLVVEGDEERLIQIFSNLVDNAIRFTHEGNVTFGIASVNDTEAEFFVSDTGIGIEEDKQKLIFDRFTQADQGTSRTYGGTGLGLAIVKKLLEMMGSEIHLQSEPNKGTCFWFKLPYVSDTQYNSKKQASPVPATNGLQPEKNNKTRILVVEDDMASVQYFKQILNKKFTHIWYAGTGKQALELHKTVLPTVILMDIGLPDMSGLDVIKEIRETDKNVKIIAQTAYAMADDKQNAHQVGSNDFLTKPIQTSVLLKKLQHL